MPRTIVLAYSGGLDTSIIVPWLRENYDARVICVAADIGQDREELKGVREKAIASGAEDADRDLIHDMMYNHAWNPGQRSSPAEPGMIEWVDSSRKR